MDGGAQYNPRTVEEVFRDLKGRRAGMIKALTTGTALSLSLSILFSDFYVALWVMLRLFVVVFLFSFFLADVEEFYQRCDPG